MPNRRQPYPGDSAGGQVAAHLNTPPPRPSAIQPNVPRDRSGHRHGHGQRPRQPLCRPPSSWPTPPTTRHPPHRSPSASPKMPPAPSRRDEPRAASRPSTEPAAQDNKPAVPNTSRRSQQRPTRLAACLATPTRRTLRHPPPATPPAQAVAPKGHRDSGCPVDWWPSSPPPLSSPASSKRPERPSDHAAHQHSAPRTRIRSSSHTAVHRPQRPPRCGGGQRPATSTSATATPGVELAAGSNTQVELPFIGLTGPGGVAVDSAGNVYVADGNHNAQVLELAAGWNTPDRVAVYRADGPGGVAVDSAGNVYVAEAAPTPGLKLPAGRTPSRAAVFPLSYVINSPPTARCSSCRRGRAPRACCRLPASIARRWRWTPPATCTSPTRKQPGAGAAGGVEDPERAAVHRPEHNPGGCGGGLRRQRIRHRLGRRSGGEAAGAVVYRDRAAVHRPPRTRRCGGGCRRQPLRHRPCQQSGGEAAGGVTRPTAGA